MSAWQAIVARVIGVVLAVALGTAMMVVVTFPLGLQELGGFLVLFYLVLFWGCAPGLLIPFLAFSIARRVSPGRVVVASLKAGLAFPICLSAIWLLALLLSGRLGLVDDPDEFLGTMTDVKLWIVSVPVALLIGVVISNIVLRRREVHSTRNLNRQVTNANLD